jgi:transposase
MGYSSDLKDREWEIIEPLLPIRKKTKPPTWTKREIFNGILYQLFTHCTKANISDDRGLIEMLSDNIDYFKSKPAELPKTTILVDNGYHPEKLTQALEAIYPEIMTKIQFELSPKPSKAEKQARGQSGFVPVAARWVIERSNAWVDRCKSLVKNFDRTLARANAKLQLCFIRLMLKRLAAA